MGTRTDRLSFRQATTGGLLGLERSDAGGTIERFAGRPSRVDVGDAKGPASRAAWRIEKRIEDAGSASPLKLHPRTLADLEQRLSEAHAEFVGGRSDQVAALHRKSRDRRRGDRTGRGRAGGQGQRGDRGNEVAHHELCGGARLDWQAGDGYPARFPRQSPGF